MKSTEEKLIHLLGDKAAYCLFNMQGGQRIYIPKSPSERFIEQLGGDIAAAAKLCNYMGGEYITLPMAVKFKFRYLLDAGHKLRDIARLLGRSERRITKMMQEIRLQRENERANGANANA
jgi:hypothetical protein